MSAQISEVNLPGRAWNIPAHKVKTKRARQVPLSKVAMAAFSEQMLGKKESDRVFEIWANSWSFGHGFRRICHNAGISGLVVHDLRHEGTSRLCELRDGAKARLNMLELMSITGHSSPSVLARYSNLRPSEIATLLD